MGSPAAAVAAGLLSHAILDAVPHHDAAGPRDALVDVALGLVGLFLLRRHMGPLAWWGALAATLPDVEVVLRYYGVLHPSPWGFPSHNWAFLHHRSPPPGGVLVQAPFLLLALLSLVSRAQRCSPGCRIWRTRTPGRG